MSRRLRAVQRKIELMVEGLNDLIAVANLSQTSWSESVFFNWQLNALLNTKHEIERTGIVRRRHRYSYLVNFDEKTRRVQFRIEVSAQDLVERRKVLETILAWFQSCEEIALFRQLTRDCVLKFARDSSMALLIPSQLQLQELAGLSPDRQEDFVRKAKAPFEHKGDGYLLKLYPLRYPIEDSPQGNAGYLFELLPYFLARIDFPRVPRSQWSEEEIRQWETAWKPILLPLDKGKFSWKEVSWDLEFLKKVEAADAIELPDDIKQLVMEEWNKQFKKTGRQYVEIPYSEEADNERLIRNLRGRAHACIGAELEDGESGNCTSLARHRPMENWRENPIIHWRKAVEVTGDSKSRLYELFKDRPDKAGFFFTSDVEQRSGYKRSKSAQNDQD